MSYNQIFKTWLLCKGFQLGGPEGRLQ